MSSILLIICKNCKEVLSTNQETIFDLIQDGILLLRKFPSCLDAIDQENKYISSLDEYDIYCVYSELKCVNCHICIGKKYRTKNEFLIQKSINFSINCQQVLQKEYFVEQSGKNFTKHIESQKLNNNIVKQSENNSKNIETQKFNSICLFNIVNLSKGIQALPCFFDSQYKVQKKSIKRMLKRVENLENQITLIIDFLSKQKNLNIKY